MKQPYVSGGKGTVLSYTIVTRKRRTDGKRGIIVYGYKFRPLLRAE